MLELQHILVNRLYIGYIYVTNTLKLFPLLEYEMPNALEYEMPNAPSLFKSQILSTVDKISFYT